MRNQGSPADWDRPSHAEIRTAIDQLGTNGFEEIREALTGGAEPFTDQMKRRMATRRAALRRAYNVLRAAGTEKVRTHLAARDHGGLTEPRSRRRTKTGSSPAPVAH
ncbi:MAG: hypothetical protein J0H98_07215 [Solirubrobacterales bacterium]|nr:hypothetical protein [Solirubrobacterales bacterium]